MLVLTRRIGETIIANDNITFTILGITGKQAKIGVNAPAGVSLHREEVYKKIQDDKAANELKSVD